MNVEYRDYNGAAKLLDSKYKLEWQDVEEVLKAMPLHLKSSDQAGIKGNPIFDPVGTNFYIKNALEQRKWRSNLAIPEEFKAAFGLDVDFVSRGLLSEVQFSNYPFLLNNVLRSEFFVKSKVKFNGEPIEVVVIITKGKMFPASQSTLYFEQAENQLTALEKLGAFTAPIRLVGLLERPGAVVTARWTEYDQPRYSRTILSQRDYACRISDRGSRSRCDIELIRGDS